jgi:hypothetical protein
MSLQTCIQAAGLAHALKPGLQALGANSRRVQVGRPARATASVDLDTALTAAKVAGAKWDYGICRQRREYLPKAAG